MVLLIPGSVILVISDNLRSVWDAGWCHIVGFGKMATSVRTHEAFKLRGTLPELVAKGDLKKQTL